MKSYINCLKKVKVGDFICYSHPHISRDYLVNRKNLVSEIYTFYALDNDYEFIYSTGEYDSLAHLIRFLNDGWISNLKIIKRAKC